MVCLYCQSETAVINSRPQKRQNTVWRRRRCLNCGAIFTSSEQFDLAAALRVQTSPKHLTPFLRDKLLLSIYKSCSHRPEATADATALTATVIARLMKLVDGDAVIKPLTIINVVTVVLQRFDKASAVHYTAFHPTK